MNPAVPSAVRLGARIAAVAVLPLLGTVPIAAAAATTGSVVDLNNRPLAQAMVTLTRAQGAAGPTALTVFSDAQGQFAFPASAPAGTLTVRRLGYAQVDGAVSTGAGPALLIMRANANDAGVAPASAWLAHVTDPQVREPIIDNCVGCHQLPAPEVRAYAKLIDDTPEDHSAGARSQVWEAIVQQMNYISAQEFSRAGGGPAAAGENVYSGGEPGPMAQRLATALTGPLQELEGYHYGAALAVTPRTLIREYEIPAPNAIREAVTLDDPNVLWAADVSTNRVMRVDALTGAVRDFTIPGTALLGPHTLVPGADGLWVTAFFPGHMAHLDPHSGSWKIWALPPVNGHPVGVHDLSFDPNHQLATDSRGRIWFSDIANNSLGWIDPSSGRTGSYPVPPVPGRVGGEQIYGLAMSADHRQLWYAQVGIGCFGSFDTEALRFGTHVVLPDRDSGPRRISISPDGVLYVALYGSGQLAEYDTRTQHMVAIHDLPDRASAPYSTTWDPRREVVWITTSNADVIYRFDPRSRVFSVLPMPRQRAFLRSVTVDPHSGELVTSYANIVQHVRGPRMALLIDPGDAPAAAPTASAAGAP